MATYSRQLLSGSTNGRAVAVAATATPGTLVHTAIAGTAAFDEVYIWASNVSGSVQLLTLEWGGVTDPGDHMVHQVSLPPNSPPIPIATGQVLQNGLVVRAFCPNAGTVNLTGFVNRIQ